MIRGRSDNMLQVTPVRAFTDNYIWLIHSPRDPRQVVAVDPGDAAPVERILADRSLTLSGLLITHHHGDHVGGVADLLRERSIPVYGPANEAIPGNPTRLREGDRAELSALGLEFSVLDVPGHTAGHIAYVGHGALFCGDTLFSAGCGRLFEGTPAQMHASLSKLAALPSDTRVCCTHEYTLSNLRFAAAVEPGNAARVDYDARCQALRAEGKPTLPSSIGLERRVNPFLRCDVPEVKASAHEQGAEGDDAVSVLAALREWKNRYR